MKKLMIMAVIGTAAGLCMFQHASAAQVEGGLKIGVNFAFFRGADIEVFPYLGSSWLMRFGLCGGGFVALPLSKTLAVQAEALITTKGSHESGTLFGDDELPPYSLKITYLEIPLLLRAMTTSDTVQVFFLAGPALGLKLGSRLMRGPEVIPFSGVKSTDLGLVFGIGAVTYFGSWFELRYTAGMSKMIEEDGVPLNIKNGEFSLIVGYRF